MGRLLEARASTSSVLDGLLLLAAKVPGPRRWYRLQFVSGRSRPNTLPAAKVSAE